MVGKLVNVKAVSQLINMHTATVGSDLQPWAIRDISAEHRLSRGRGLVLGAGCAVADIVGYVILYAGPIHCLSCLCLHPVYPLICSVQVGKDTVEEFWGNTYSGSFERAGLNG